MCKYCDFEYEDEDEKSTDFRKIFSVMDGHIGCDLTLDRYVEPSNDYRHAKLHLTFGAEVGSFFEMIKLESIDIKYCPFCGEEL